MVVSPVSRMIKLALMTLAVASAASVKREISDVHLSSGAASFAPAVTSTLGAGVLSPLAGPAAVGNLYAGDDDDNYRYRDYALGHEPYVSGELEEVDGDVAWGSYYGGPRGPLVLTRNLGRLVRIPDHLDPAHDPLAPPAFYGRLSGYYY